MRPPPGQRAFHDGGHATRGPVRGGITGTVVLLLGLVAGCSTGTTTAEAPSVRSNELADAGGHPCPEELPIGEDPAGYGFGVEEPATQRPHLLEAQQAWVCEYALADRPDGTTVGWGLAAQPSLVAESDLADLRTALAGLDLIDPDRACTDDLGPRWMVVYTHDGDLTGVVVDGYGCRSVRLSDNPHSTPPGADGQEGAVGGILDGGRAVLEAVGVGRAL